MMGSVMRKKRLARLAYMLRNQIPESRFDMTLWRTLRSSGPPCYCAGGWAAKKAWFRRRGLRIKDGTIYLQGRKDVDDFRALTKFFGITYDQAQELFGPWNYSEENITLEMVASRVDGLLKGEWS